MDAPITSHFDAHFGKFTSISNDAYEFLKTHFAEKGYQRNEFLTEAGTIPRFFYLVLEGVQVIYLIDAKGEKVVLGFSFKGTVSGVYDSFLQQQPSHFFLEALTPTKTLAINLDGYNELFHRFPEFYRWRTHFMEGILFGRTSREVEMLTLSAKERFDQFMARCPLELLQIPQKYLASYLNMKPETFSRMRAIKD